MIRSELGVIEDDISIWNKMMFSISQLNINNRSLKGERTSFLLSKSIKNKFYHKIHEVDLENVEIIQKKSVWDSLRTRRKEQRLTFNKKFEIFKQIKSGVLIKYIKEIMQISDSTI